MYLTNVSSSLATDGINLNKGAQELIRPHRRLIAGSMKCLHVRAIHNKV